MSRPNADLSGVIPSEGGYGSFVVCPSCSRQSDIWLEHCACAFSSAGIEPELQFHNESG